MKTKHFVFGIAAAFIALFCLSTVFADGMLIIDPPIYPPIHPPIRPPVPPRILRPEALPVKFHRVDITIDNQVATTHIDQAFKNDYDIDLEGTYIFPLPEEASISDFSMYIDGKKVSGEILDKDKAREIYEDIVRKMRDPGLLEYVGRNMFKARVYPIPKHGEKRIELTYQQTIKYDNGLYSYIYPLNTEKFSPKPLEEVTISAKIKSKLPIKTLYSPSHTVDTKINQYEASCGFEDKNVKPDKDFVLYYTVSDKDVGLNLLTFRKLKEDGYFMLFLAPGKIEGKTIDKDIVFVLDSSGSMQGDKIKQAKDALRFCINSLGKGDMFNVINFATDVNPFKDTLVAANSDNNKNALDFIDKIEARGGTDINSSLTASLKMFKDTKRLRMIVFLTDGEPTVGVTSMDEIVKNVEKENIGKVRIFDFGVGNDVNAQLLDKIAEEQRGVSEYVKPEENIEVKVSSFYSKISDPILSDISLDFGKIKTKDVYPKTLPDIFKGTQIMLFGRYEGEGATSITLKGMMNGKEQKFVYEGKFPVESKESEFIPRIWATRKIGYLMSEIRLKGENKELTDEIIKLSKEYGIMTPYTSFLVVEERKEPALPGQFSMAPSPLHYKSARMLQENLAMSPPTGSGAVQKSIDINALKSSEQEAKPTSEAIKQVGDKTFYLRNGVWVDSKYKEGDKVKKIKYMSDEYFDLLNTKPGIGKYLAIDKKIIVFFENEFYQIEE